MFPKVDQIQLKHDWKHSLQGPLHQAFVLGWTVIVNISSGKPSPTTHFITKSQQFSEGLELDIGTNQVSVEQLNDLDLEHSITVFLEIHTLKIL